ncbi:formimidoylglutamase [Psychrosphaera sp.]|nr:formimidoylglutamase [Psychrosphaera sp.]
MSKYLRYTDHNDLASFQNRRLHETHVADVILLPDHNQPFLTNLQLAKDRGAEFVIVGIPEDIGPRANCGKGGAKNGWSQYLPVMLSQQANQFFNWETVLLLGELDVSDLQKQSNVATISDHKLSSLRDLCANLDRRVEELLKPIFELGLKPIVIGGGHNNAFPIIQALSKAINSQVACVNLDPHADFRKTEGRHSGNPFRYAYEAGSLSHYCVLGLHEQKNNAETIQGLLDADFPFVTYQQMFIEQSISYNDAVANAKNYLDGNKNPIGIELDLDSIMHMPASAYSSTGFTSEQAMFYVNQFASLPQNKYLHLCEGAPDGNEPPTHKTLEVAQVLTQLTYSYLIGNSKS